MSKGLKVKRSKGQKVSCLKVRPSDLRPSDLQTNKNDG